jgi:hypothetical protein
MYQKANVLTFSRYVQKGPFRKERVIIKFRHSLAFSCLLLASLFFTSFTFLFSFVFTLKFSMHGCNGGEENEAQTTREEQQ